MSNPMFKLGEPAIDQDNLWQDDALQREPAAKALTNLLKGETNPLTISMNGGWGSGKTFLLKRWHVQLKKDGFKAIYFNAWEDDFCGDPLMSIIGQLWESLKGSDLNEIGNTIKETAKPLFTKTVFNIVRVASADIVDFSKEGLKSVAEQTVDDYFEHRSRKDDLKKRLSEMAAKVAEDTGHPMVFIIDELDRCRPTFSIELLERVKHIFDIPNMVFVFGIDRNQLASSIKAIYGEIDVDGYLRRFFDMDFALPSADAATYCRHLMKRHEMAEYFEEKSTTAGTNIHSTEYNEFNDSFPKLCKQLGLSLREIEQCIRAFIFVAKNIPDRHYMFSLPLSILLLVRLKNHSLYMKFVRGECRVSSILDYVESFFGETQNDQIAHFLDILEIELYIADYSDYAATGDIVRNQLSLIAEGKSAEFPNYLSKRTREADTEKAKELLKWYDHSLLQIRFDHGRKASKDRIHNYLVPTIELTLMMPQDVWR